VARIVRAASYNGAMVDLERSMDLYVVPLEEPAGRSNVDERMLRDVSRAAHDVAIDFYGPGLARVGRSAWGVGLGG
jgi:hypothetical protein